MAKTKKTKTFTHRDYDLARIQARNQADDQPRRCPRCGCPDGESYKAVSRLLGLCATCLTTTVPIGILWEAQRVLLSATILSSIWEGDQLGVMERKVARLQKRKK
jgi:hypothetical protein